MEIYFGESKLKQARHQDIFFLKEEDEEIMRGATHRLTAQLRKYVKSICCSLLLQFDGTHSVCAFLYYFLLFSIKAFFGSLAELYSPV